MIFDLGGVIIDLDLEASYREFSRLSGLEIPEVINRTRGLMLFEDYETGAINSQDFRNQINELLEMTATNQEIDHAWCALLGEIPSERLNLLNKLKHGYRTFALSNTNDIHAQKFDQIAEQSLGNAVLFSEHFERVYLSHEMKMRKPNIEIYQTVLADQDLNPSETLFIDDNLENILGAESVGIQTVHLKDPGQLIAVFDGTW